MKTVDMIASGYEWVCPTCDEMNLTIETGEIVVCQNCKEKFKVGNIEHAEGTGIAESIKK